MKIIKYVLLTLVGIVILALVVAAFLPKTFHAEGTTVINKPAQEVYDYVKYVKNQENYGVWFQMDKNMEKSFDGTDATVGFKYSWKSKEVGNGSQVISKLDNGKRVEFDLYFEDDPQPAKSFIKTDSIAPNQTKVRWVIDGKIPYPFNLMSLFYDMNKDFEQGTLNLKNVLEKQ